MCFDFITNLFKKPEEPKPVDNNLYCKVCNKVINYNEEVYYANEDGTVTCWSCHNNESSSNLPSRLPVPEEKENGDSLSEAIDDLIEYNKRKSKREKSSCGEY